MDVTKQKFTKYTINGMKMFINQIIQKGLPNVNGTIINFND